MKNLIYLIVSVTLSGCGSSFLDVRPNQGQRIPKSIADYNAMMDNTSLLNTFSSHALGMIGSDEYFMLDARYDAFPVGSATNYMKRAYTWEKTIYEGGEIVTDWSRGYSRILQCNIVLDGLLKMDASKKENELWRQAKGNALFFRALNYYWLAQLYCDPYLADSASQALGLPLRVEADVTISVARSTVEETYRRIVDDLLEAESLLPELPDNMCQASKCAVFALLAKTYMQMGRYDDGLIAASRSLSIKRNLINFNHLDLDVRYVFPANGEGNPEIIMFTSATNMTPLTTARQCVDTALFASYGDNDLRKTAYFHHNSDGRILFKGSYVGNPAFFTGLAVDEVILNRAECSARLGDFEGAKADMQYLFDHRIDDVVDQKMSKINNDNLLDLIVSERRKELVLRGTRWEDLRRFNNEGAFREKIERRIHDTTYELLPGSKRYTWPLPVEAIAAGKYEQNSR
ncbi:RagB/SusD family nutrient uptake outer membrane protein [Parapedobacter sp. 2B3]|uniref:RagB/SusD family nutrient uptake outer membrane protein n=1 Tax=Parapedobacter sp. 2B3 TaxID=3342381 RepID=UPI0035B6AAC0